MMRFEVFCRSAFGRELTTMQLSIVRLYFDDRRGRRRALARSRAQLPARRAHGRPRGRTGRG